MKYLTRCLLIYFVICAGMATSAIAQINEDLYIYGYFQGTARYTDLDSNPKSEVDQNLSFAIQQMDLFLFKQIDDKFSTFANLEITNTFSSADGWGSLALDEAWVKYDPVGKLKLKAGILVPPFNNLNTIKDKTPLLPYIIRPLAYERGLQEIFKLDELVPRQASVEVYGLLGLGEKLKFDYSVYVGNQVASVITTTAGTLPAGADTTLAKLVGGRIGIRYDGIKAGISGTIDRADLSKIPIFVAEFDGVGTLPRNRLGLDFSLSYPRFFFESEFIGVFYDLNAEKKRQLEELVSANPLLSPDLNRLFAYGALGFNIGERCYAYSMFSYFEDRSNIITNNGFGMFGIGGGFRPNDALVLKAQFIAASTYSKTIFFGREKDVMLALSVFL